MDDLAQEALIAIFGEIFLGAMIVFVANRKQLKQFLIDSFYTLLKTIKKILIK